MTEPAVTVRDRAEQIVRSIERTGSQLIRWWWTPLRITGAVVLLVAIAIAVLGYLNELERLYLTETAQKFIEYLFANVSVELASIAITMVFVDALYDRRETEREKKRLILQMGSPDNAFAREAVRTLRSHGWLQNGTLKGAYLEGANLQEASLGDADLQRANLWGARLQGAKLSEADLQGADLSGAKLQGVDLRSAKLQGANLWLADLQGADLSDAQLQATKLKHADLQGANLTRAKYNDATVWPVGFTPPPEAINVDAETNVED